MNPDVGQRAWWIKCKRDKAGNIPVEVNNNIEFLINLKVAKALGIESAAAVREYANELALTFPLVLDPRGEINAAYGVIGLPTSFLIGRNGRAVALGSRTTRVGWRPGSQTDSSPPG